MIKNNNAKTVMSALELAQLGDGEVAYIRPMTSDQFQEAFPEADKLPSGIKLWALLNADGAPIVIGDSRDAIIANAWEHELQPVSVH
ncbi:MAG: DUF1150 domain-containing protein [Hyphomicrobiales bacterium]